MNEQKVYNDLEPYTNSRKSKRPHFDKRRYTNREALPKPSQRYTAKGTVLESSRSTWKSRHDNKVYQTTKEVVVYNPPSPTRGQQSTDVFQRKSFIPLNVSRGDLFDKLKGWSDFSDAHPLHLDSKDDRWRSNKYCKFHKDHKHLMEHCRELIVYINHLVC